MHYQAVNVRGSKTLSTTYRVLVWDLPTRLFHWLFAGGFIVAAALALLTDEHGPLFPFHALFGLIVALMVVLRVVWGFAGTRHARFTSFAFGPGALLKYLRGALSGDGIRYAGHNPGAAWAIFGILSISIGLTITGIMIGQGKESVEDLHEFLAYAMMAVVVVHIMGVLFHTIRHRENIIASMLHGRKDARAQEAISSSRPIAAAVFLILVSLWTSGLYANYDAVAHSTRLPLIGVPLQLGEVEN